MSRKGTEQVMTFMPVHDQLVPLALTSVAPEGRVSRIVTAFARERPAFVTVRV